MSSSINEKRTVKRVTVYIDGFNLYFGLRSKVWRRYYWLNVRELASSLLKEDQSLVQVKYFTARVRHNPEKQRRQNTFLEALGTLPGVRIFYGKYLVNAQECRRCGAVSSIPSEKMTDVNIAVELLVDAFKDAYDTALLVSADSDLTGPLRAIRGLFPKKRLVVAFPPNRSSWDLQQISHGYFTIGQSKFKRSQFPDEVLRADGFVLRKPERWR